MVQNPLPLGYLVPVAFLRAMMILHPTKIIQISKNERVSHGDSYGSHYKIVTNIISFMPLPYHVLESNFLE